jgi:hypothetical protein
MGMIVAWNTLKEFSKVKVDCTDDALLFECGVYNFTGHDLFHFSLVRQFSFEDNDEYDHMEQLQLTVYFEPNDVLQEFKTNLWTSDCDSWDDFFNKVEQMKEFKTTLHDFSPLRAEVYQEQI